MLFYNTGFNNPINTGFGFNYYNFLFSRYNTNLGIGFNNTNFLPQRPQMLQFMQNTEHTTNKNEPYPNMSFQAFCAKITNNIPEVTCTAKDKQMAILAKTAILNHPQCPQEIKSTLLKEIAVINSELQKMGAAPSAADSDIESFSEIMKKDIPDDTTTIDDKQKAILAKTAVLNHPQCSDAQKSALFNEIRTINNEIMQMKYNCNTMV